MKKITWTNEVVLEVKLNFIAFKAKFSFYGKHITKSFLKQIQLLLLNAFEVNFYRCVLLIITTSKLKR